MPNPPYSSPYNGPNSIATDANISTGTPPNECEQSTSQTYVTPTDPLQSEKRFSRAKTWLAKEADLQPAAVKDAGGAGDSLLVASWGIHWYTPTTIVFLFIVGIASAIGHHVYYTKMHGTPVKSANSQEWVIRIGTALAFLCGSTLGAVVGISRNQWSWLTMRREFMSLKAIDAMFGASSDLLCFFNTDMLRRAKLVSVMAVVMWLIPIATIFTPGTITVHNVIGVNTSRCTVPTMKFVYDNTTSSQELGLEPPNDSLAIEFLNAYNQPSPRARKIFTVAAFADQISPANNITLTGTTLGEDCGANCTYAITFEGPAIKCTEHTPWNETAAPWGEPNQFETNYTPNKTTMFNKSTYFRAQKATSLDQPNTLWVGQTAGNGDFDIPHVYSCQASVARYEVSMEIRDSTYREPIITAVDIRYPITAVPIPQEFNLDYYDNWALLDTLSEILVGSIGYQVGEEFDSVMSELVTNTTKIGSTALVTVENPQEAKQNLGAHIEVMAQKMAVSLLSDPTLKYAGITNSTCTSTLYHNVFKYTPWRLAAVYGALALFALLTGALGFVALMKNGVACDTNFSTILLTTRNPTLDKLAAGACLGGLPTGLEDVKLRFGEVGGVGVGEGIGEIGHVAMGVEGEVMEIRKRGCYT